MLQNQLRHEFPEVERNIMQEIEKMNINKATLVLNPIGKKRVDTYQGMPGIANQEEQGRRSLFRYPHGERKFTVHKLS